MNRRGLLALAWTTLAAAAGCGYSTEPLLAFDPQAGPVRTVCVPVVSNDLHRRQFEEPLTDAVIKEIAATTELAVVTEGQDPDSELRIELVDVQERTSIENRLDVVVAGRVSFAVSVRWLDRRTGREIPLLSRVAQDQRRFTATRGETFATAAAELSEKIAEKIVEGMVRGMRPPRTGSGEHDA